MTAGSPLVVVLAGPNGAGKSTTAPYLVKEALAVEEFVNADTIAQGLSAYRPETTAVAAGRVMLERLHVLARARRDFAFETTLAGRSYERWLRDLRATGYRAHLVFLSLPSADLAVARVADRVRRGGHHLPDEVVRRRFLAGAKNLFSVYMDAVDAWTIYDNADVMSPRLVASRAVGGSTAIADTAAWNAFEGATVMTLPKAGPTPAERAGDLDRIERALRAAVRDTLLRHKRDGDPVAVWREGRVVWLQPDDIPITPDEALTSKADGPRR